MKVFFPAEGETDLVREFFQSRIGYFVDVGANQPDSGSQTFHLEQLGWTGVLIEPLPEWAEANRRQRKAKVYEVICSSPQNDGRTMSFQVAGAFSSLDMDAANAKATAVATIQVPATTLDKILIDAQAVAPIDFLSIDVEGHEIDVLRGFDIQRWRPRLILIEDLVIHRRLHNYLLAQGYAWMRRTGINSWYVPAPLPQPIDFQGRLKFFRKYYLGTPFRRLRQIGRQIRRRMGLIRQV